MFFKVLIVFICINNFFLNVQANEKKFIIDRFLEIDNFSFDFDQISNKKVETGNCLLKFDNKLRCKYNNKLQKEIIINNKKLVILQKRYNKIYYYPVSKSPFINILSKKKLINLIKNSDLVLNDNIELIYLDENQKKITVFFEKKSYNLIGWLVEDSFQNEVYFSLRINETNIEINKNYFKIPKIN